MQKQSSKLCSGELGVRQNLRATVREAEAREALAQHERIGRAVPHNRADQPEMACKTSMRLNNTAMLKANSRPVRLPSLSSLGFA
jgi:hypothetical protein